MLGLPNKPLYISLIVRLRGKTNTVNKTRGFLKRFILWCLESGHLEDNPLPKELLGRKSETVSG